MWRWPAVLVLILAAGPAVGGPAEAVRTARKDVATVPVGDGPTTRYLTLNNLAVSERVRAVQVLQFQVNSLSREPEMASLTAVGPDLLRLNTVDYGWSKENGVLFVYGKLADTDPYFHLKGSAAPWLPARELAELSSVTVSQVPVIRGDWFFATTARQLDLNGRVTEAGYYDFLGFKKRQDVFDRCGLDAKASVKLGKQVRAVLEQGDSGVSQNNRQIERLQALTGGYWYTLDADANDGKKDATAQLRPGDFDHTAEEHYGVLPNGLFAYYLGNAAGEAQNTAPDNIVGPDDSPLRRGHDGRIHVPLSCVRCHIEDGLRPIDDWARRTLIVPVGLTASDPKLRVEFKRQYFSNLNRHLRDDRAKFAEAVREATAVSEATVRTLTGDPTAQPAKGLTVSELAEAYAWFWDRYATEKVTVARIAAETGYAEDEFLARLRRWSKAAAAPPAAALAPWLAEPPGSVPRVKVEQSFAVLMIALASAGTGN